MLCSSTTIAKTINRSELKDIAQQLVNAVNKETKYSSDEIDQNNQGKDYSRMLSSIPDGSQLLFRPRVSKISYEYEILATKQSGEIFISLYDLTSVLEFPIFFSEDNKTASGWFLREDWLFNLDLNDNTVTSKGNKISINNGDVYIENEEIYVREEALERWFDMKYELDIAMQYMNIYSEYPLPKVAQHLRNTRSNRNSNIVNKPKLPRKNVEYDNFDINIADITVGTTYRKTDPPQVKPNNSKASIAVEGELLQHSAYALASADNKNGLNTIISRLKKENEDPILLGPLKARSYSLGDTHVTRVPLTGSTGQEFGFNVSNNPLSNTDFETTQIQGDGLPGWDVELYRNGALTSTITIDETGRYLFDDIQLFGGNNTFELFFYGPQGEIRTDSVNVPVNEALLSTQNNTYEFSTSLTDKRTYEQFKSDDIDEGSLHVAGKYNFFLGDALSYIGFRSRQHAGEQKTFLGTGVTKIIKGTIVDANIGVDDQGETAGKITGRRDIKGWDIALSGEVRSDDYKPADSSDVKTLQTIASINKNYKSSIGTRGNISAKVDHSTTADGIDIDKQRLTIGNSFKRMNISNTISAEQITNQEDRLNNTLSLRYRKNKFLIRSGVKYNVKPTNNIDEYFSQYTYQHSPKFTADLRLNHQPERKFSEARLNLNYIHDKVRISPFIEIDSNDEILGGLNLNSTLVNEDSVTNPVITSDRLIGRGLVSAFVYHDKNGDKIFNNDDEALPEVTVESVNVRKRAISDEKGTALIKGLPDNRATDIRVDASTLPDPFMIPATKGQSIFPRGGDIVNMEFPIHLAGELDGVVSINKKNGKTAFGRLIRMQLIPTSGDISKVQTARSASDGFFVFPQVPPGEYLLTPHYDDLKKQNVGQTSPEKVTIGYDGTIIYGKNITLSENLPATKFNAKDGGSQSYVLSIGNKGKSKLSSILSRILARKAQTNLMSQLQRIKIDKNTERFVTPTGTLKESFEVCQGLIQNNMPCEIEQAMLKE